MSSYRYYKSLKKIQRGHDEKISAFFIALYGQSIEMIRYYDKLKYTCWTIYIAIVAGLYTARHSNEISTFGFLVMCILNAAFFILMISRIQRNYQYFYQFVEKFEEIAASEFEQHISSRIIPLGDKGETISNLPFASIIRHLGFIRSEHFIVKLFGAIPLFILHILFIVSIPIAIVFLRVEVAYLKIDEYFRPFLENLK